MISSSLKTDSLLLRVSNLSKAFGGQQVLEEVSLELHQAEVVLLRGANGSGKTTLLNLLTGNLQPDRGVIELFTNGKAEEFSFPLSWWQKLSPFNHFTPEQVATEGVGRTWQDIRLFKTQSLLENIAVATPQQLGENPFNNIWRRGLVKKQEKQIRQDSKVMLAQLGLSGREQSSADKVSLGQSKRVAIARAVQAGAKILFLDEPLAGLDAPGISDVMELLTQLAHQEGVTLVIIEHIFNIPRILELATTVWTLEGGKVSSKSVISHQSSVISDEEGNGQHFDKLNASQVIGNSDNAVIERRNSSEDNFNTCNLDQAKAILDNQEIASGEHSATSQELNTASPSRNDNSQQGIREWLESLVGTKGKIQQSLLSGGAILSIVQPEGVTVGEVLLEVENLVVYRGKRLVIGVYGENAKVEGLSFKLCRGELGVLQAPNGWGKTTLLEAIAGVLPIRQGVIRVRSKPIQKLPTWERVRLGLSLLQARDNVFPSLTVKEVLKLAQVKEIPENLRGLVHKSMSALSGGERQKVVISDSLMGNDYNIGVLDEPFSALDPNAIIFIQSLIFDLLINDKGLLLAIPIGVKNS